MSDTQIREIFGMSIIPPIFAVGALLVSAYILDFMKRISGAKFFILTLLISIITYIGTLVTLFSYYEIQK